MMVVDLPGFGDRLIEDGIEATDALLHEVGQTLRRVLPDADLFTRCGPATFLIAMNQGGRRARFAATRARDVLQPLAGSARTAVVDVPRSIGAQSPEHLVEYARRSLHEPHKVRRRRVG
jgi:GGDEF domain-containing protein